MTAIPTLQQRSTLNRWMCAGGAFVGCAALAGYVFVANPNNPASLYPQCPLKAMTGADCPGCGGLRATYALLHGDIAGAFDHNAVAAILVPVMAYLIVRWMFAQFDISLPAIRLPRWSAVAIPLVVLVFSIVRNIAWGPFWYFNSAA